MPTEISSVTASTAPCAPRIFVSYSHDSPDHEDRVRAFADRMVSDGIDVSIDQYEPHPREGWPRWTERQIDAADFVLIVCTERSARRVSVLQEAAAPSGVIWELSLIYNHLYSSGAASGKFIPILVDSDGERAIPAALRHLERYCVTTDVGYDALYSRITNQAGGAKPDLGKLRNILPRPVQSGPPGSQRLASRPLIADHNRKAMIARVRHDWIRGVLEGSFYCRARIGLPLVNLRSVRHHTPDHEPEVIEPGWTMADLFEQHVRALLILGAPGSGKTSLLLDLARTLLDGAEADDRQPIPAIFKLSSWSVRRCTLPAWLAAELNERFDVPRAIAEEWVAAGMVLPLLDGLDEVSAADRDACVSAINAFRREYARVPIAITSRLADYESLSTRLRVPAAICIQPLTPDHVRGYLDNQQEQLHPLRDSIEKDPGLIEFYRSPLLLEMAVKTLRRRPSPASDTGAARTDAAGQNRERIVDTYIAAMLSVDKADAPYTAAQIVRWLNWLARTMKRE